MPLPKPKIGVSSCLLGNTVRYDGGHKHNRYITDTLGAHAHLVPWCPEVAIGLGTPRKPIRLERAQDKVRVIEVANPAHDVTGALKEYARAQAGNMGQLAGFIFKKNSPSCGMQRVKVYETGKRPAPVGTGAFAAEVMSAHPDLRVEEEGRLQDPGLRANFTTRLFTRHRWQLMCSQGLTPAGLVDFHTRHKFLVLAHNESVYRELGPLVARAGNQDRQAVAEAYFTRLMQGLKSHATPARHANVLEHILGFFKHKLATADKAELLDLIEQQRLGLVPLIAPITLIRHHLRKFEVPFLTSQVYLDPCPGELLQLPN